MLQLVRLQQNFTKEILFAMNTVTQKMLFRQSLIQFAQKNGVTKAAIKYNVSRQYVYRWKNRYDGKLQSLADQYHRPHSHPNQHTEHELQLIRNTRHRNPHAGLVVFWVKLRQRGYTRSITGLYRVLSQTWRAEKDITESKIHSLALKKDALSQSKSPDRRQKYPDNLCR